MLGTDDYLDPQKNTTMSLEGSKSPIENKQEPPHFPEKVKPPAKAPEHNHILPDWLFFEVDSTEFNDAPPGVINVTRLINNQDCWQTNSFSKKPKTLILADWTMREWTYSKLDDVFSWITRMLQQGFVIYLLQPGTLVPLTQNSLGLLYNESAQIGVLPTCSQNIIKMAAKQYRLPKEQLQIMDDHILETLLYNKPLNREMRILLSEDFFQLPIDEIKRICCKTPFKRAALVHTDMTNIDWTDELSAEKKQLISSLKVIREVNHLDVPVNKLNILLSDNQTYWKIDWEEDWDKDNTIDLAGLEHIKTVSLIGERPFFPTVKISELIQLYKKLPRLESLHFSKLNFEDINFSQLNISFDRILTLRFRRCRIHFPSFNKIIECNPKLRSLDILSSLFYEIPENPKIKAETLSSLHELVYANSNLECFKLLIKAPQLKILSTSVWEDDINSPLLNLEEFNFIHEEEQVNLNTLTGIAPKLKTFSAMANVDDFEASYHGVCMSPNDDSDSGSLKDNTPTFFLEKITLSGGKHITTGTIEKIFKKFPTVKIQLDEMDHIEPKDEDTSDNEYDDMEELMNGIKKFYSKHQHRIEIKAPLQGNRISAAAKEASAFTSPPEEICALDTNGEITNEVNINDIPIEDSKIPENAQTTNNQIPSQTKIASHQLEDFFHTKPKTDFQFQGLNKTRNQDMIVEKLSQYLTLMEENQEIIPQIQKGICAALAALFISHFKNWEKIINPILTWNGSRKELERNKKLLKEIFDLIISFIIKYQLSDKHDSYFIGNNVNELLKNKRSYVIFNPWHAIAIVPLLIGGRQAWINYDPNHPDRPINVSEAVLPNTIKTQLGNLLFISIHLPPEPRLAISISSYSDFLAEGGLLAIHKAKNREQIWDTLIRINEPPLSILSQKALKGILLQNTNGQPAWAIALKDGALCRYTTQLLQYYLTECEHSLQGLQNSLVNLSPGQQKAIIPYLKKGELLELCNPLNKFKQPLFDPLIDAITNNPNSNYYLTLFETWKKDFNKNHEVSRHRLENPLPSYLRKLITHIPDEKSILVQLKSAYAIQSIQLALQEYCQRIKMPVFYAHSPRDLICSARWIQCDYKNTGIIQKGPGGTLYDFLQKHAVTNSILIVNYDTFNTAQVVQFNALIDKIPMVDGIPLPPTTKLIGLININNSTAYQGADFYSRFSRTELCPLPKKALSVRPLPFVTEAKNLNASQPFVMEFYGSPDWENLLFGAWTIKANSLVFQEGLLEKAIRENNYLFEIRNGPWEITRFQQAWHQICQLGYIHYANRTILLKKRPILMKTSGYRLEKMPFITRKSISVENMLVLNPTSFHCFVSQYKIIHLTQTLESIAGWVEEYARKTLQVYLTRELTPGQWATLADHCRHHEVKMEVYCGFKNDPDQKVISCSHTRVIESNDMDASIHCIITDKKSISSCSATIGKRPKSYEDILPHSVTGGNQQETEEKWQVIDVSECGGADLLKNIRAEWDEEEWSFRFTQSDCVLINDLNNKKNIILKGNFSPELIDELQPFLLQRVCDKNAPGKLILIIDNNPFHYLQSEKHTINEQDGLKHLPLCQLRAHERFKEIFPDYDPWIGMRTLPPPAAFFKEEKINYLCSKEIAEQFTQQRLTAVNKMLSIAPYVFLTGLTGIGKSTFVQKEFLKYLKEEKLPGRLYQSEAAIKAWACDQAEGKKILFIDEANLSKRQWSEFEGLFYSPPSILIKGTNYTLTETHKVIFAGNPVSYGDERTLAPFFERHGNAILFEPLPPEYIYEHVLKPLFTSTPIKKHTQAVSAHILKMYCFLNQRSGTEVLVSPREVEMIALWLIVVIKSQTSEDCIRLAQYLSYELGKNLVPQQYRQKFDEVFKPKFSLHSQGTAKLGKDFLLTPSRQPIVSLLDYTQQLHALRAQNQLSEENEILLYGGLGGIILEGNPAAGKSELVNAYLQSAGYQEQCAKTTSLLSSEKIFYRIPVSMSLAEKEGLLLDAFHQGAIVVIDEINSTSLMEQLLNALTMGRTPTGERPKHPGFMIIGTQNPISMAGRRAPSNALARRLLTLSVPDYRPEELKEVLLWRCPYLKPRSLASRLITAYTVQLKKARQENLSPEPTLRDLIKVANEFNPLKPAEKSRVETSIHTSQIKKPTGSSHIKKLDHTLKTGQSADQSRKRKSLHPSTTRQSTDESKNGPAEKKLVLFPKNSHKRKAPEKSRFETNPVTGSPRIRFNHSLFTSHASSQRNDNTKVYRPLAPLRKNDHPMA